jgi:hypothetical protein
MRPNNHILKGVFYGANPLASLAITKKGNHGDAFSGNCGAMRGKTPHSLNPRPEIDRLPLHSEPPLKEKPALELSGW